MTDPSSPVQREQVLAAVRGYCHGVSGAAVQVSSDGVERIYYSGLSLLGLVDAVCAALSQGGSSDQDASRIGRLTKECAELRAQVERQWKPSDEELAKWALECSDAALEVVRDEAFLPKSAPAVRSSLPSGESDPSVTLDCAGADTDENRHEETPISMPGISAQVERPPTVEQLELIILIEFVSDPAATRRAAERVWTYLEARAKTLARQTTTSVLPRSEGQAAECDGGLRTSPHTKDAT